MNGEPLQEIIGKYALQTLFSESKGEMDITDEPKEKPGGRVMLSSVMF
jgi:hypothetical protein